LIALHRFAVPEGNALQQQLDLFRAVDAAPGFLGFLDQLECQIEEGWSRHAVARTSSPVAHGRERRLNRIRRAQMLPVLGREVVKGQRREARLDYANSIIGGAFAFLTIH
jgi:hypothetical protein